MARAGVCLVLQQGEVCVTEAVLLAVVQPDAVMATEGQVYDGQHLPLHAHAKYEVMVDTSW